MRVTTAFNRLLRLPGASVIDVSFGAEGVIVTVRLRRRRTGVRALRADRPGLRSTTGGVKRWRHLDLGASRCVIECELRRLRCRDCGVQLEAVPWARPRRAPHPRLRGHRRVAGAADGQDADRRAVADRVGHGRADRRSASSPITSTSGDCTGLVAIGVDEISYRRGQRYLTIVVDHQPGRDRVVRAGPQRRDPAGVLRSARRSQGLDPGGLDRHVRRLRSKRSASTARRRDLLRPVPRRAPRPARGRPGPPRRVERPRALPHPRRANGSRAPAGRCSRAPAKQTIDQLAKLGEVQQANRPLYRAFLLKEELRLLYQLDDPALAPAHLDAWLDLGLQIQARAVRQARPHDPPPPRRHPRRDPPRPQQRPPRRPQQPHPPDQPPQLRLPLRRNR